MTSTLPNPADVEARCAWWWAKRNMLLLDGQPLDFVNHPYQYDILLSQAQEECFRKGAQIGLTSVQMIKRIHGHKYGRYPKGSLYLFPTRADVSDFVKGRLNPFIDDNDLVSGLLQNTDSINTKRIGSSMLYFRGTNSRSQLKSIPVDSIVFDEIDEMSPNMVDLALERVSHSDLKERTDLSTPTLPDYGIDLRWQQSTQRLWWIPCGKCGRETCMELEFEQNGWQDQRVLLRRQDGSVYRACVHCHSQINPLDGEWRVTYPDRHINGWWISQLNSLRVPPAIILDAFEDPRRSITETYNSKIGMPYVDAQARLSVNQVLACCGSHGMFDNDRGPCSMGVDQGKDQHVVIGNGRAIVHLGHYREWEALDALMRDYHVSTCVVDGMPDTKAARAFAARFPGRVYLNWYSESQKGCFLWNDEQRTVTSNRTESLDTSGSTITSRDIVLPRENLIVLEFAQHCHATAKRLIEDQETGSQVYRYFKLGADHYRHAFNYRQIAQSRMGTSFFAGVSMS